MVSMQERYEIILKMLTDGEKAGRLLSPVAPNVTPVLVISAAVSQVGAVLTCRRNGPITTRHGEPSGVGMTSFSGPETDTDQGCRALSRSLTRPSILDAWILTTYFVCTRFNPRVRMRMYKTKFGLKDGIPRTRPSTCPTNRPLSDLATCSNNLLNFRLIDRHH